MCKLVVPPEYKAELQEVLKDFNEMITSSNKVLAVNNVSLKIWLERDVVVKRHPYRLEINEREAVREIIADLL